MNSDLLIFLQKLPSSLTFILPAIGIIVFLINEIHRVCNNGAKLIELFDLRGRKGRRMKQIIDLGIEDEVIRDIYQKDYESYLFEDLTKFKTSVSNRQIFNKIKNHPDSPLRNWRAIKLVNDLVECNNNLPKVREYEPHLLVKIYRACCSVILLIWIASMFITMVLYAIPSAAQSYTIVGLSMLNILVIIPFGIMVLDSFNRTKFADKLRDWLKDNPLT